MIHPSFVELFREECVRATRTHFATWLAMCIAIRWRQPCNEGYNLQCCGKHLRYNSAKWCTYWLSFFVIFLQTKNTLEAPISQNSLTWNIHSQSPVSLDHDWLQENRRFLVNYVHPILFPSYIPNYAILDPIYFTIAVSILQYFTIAVSILQCF